MPWDCVNCGHVVTLVFIVSNLLYSDLKDVFYPSLTLGAHAHDGYSTHFVCVSVCPLFSGSIKRLYNTLTTDFSKKASFKSYSVFRSFHNMVDGHVVAHCNVNCTGGALYTRVVTLLVC